MAYLSDRLRAAGISRIQLAQRLKVTRGLVGHWCTGRVRITAERARQIEQETNGAIRAHELRPDLFPLEAAAA